MLLRVKKKVVCVPVGAPITSSRVRVDFYQIICSCILFRLVHQQLWYFLVYQGRRMYKLRWKSSNNYHSCGCSCCIGDVDGGDHVAGTPIPSSPFLSSPFPSSPRYPSRITSSSSLISKNISFVVYFMPAFRHGTLDTAPVGTFDDLECNKNNSKNCKLGSYLKTWVVCLFFCFVFLPW